MLAPETPEQEEVDQFTGKGELLELPTPEAFRTIHDLVVKQEPLAKSRAAQDAHYTFTKMGVGYSSLEKVQDQDVYQQNFPPGYQPRISAVPNKAGDLVNKLTETLLVDAAKPDPQAETDSETAERGAALAKEFLEQDGGESGTDDKTLFWSQVERATTCASSFLWSWVDETGGGSIAKQIKAHPLATDVNMPLEAVDEMGQPIPTTDYVLRYVTADGQFTENPSEAERVWVPRIRVERLGREHVRTLPETKDVHDATALILLHFTTLGEAKRRWPALKEMSDGQLAVLCDWTPPRPLVLLPATLRARWRAMASQTQKTVNDERILFYYAYLRRSDPDYPEGAYLCLSGANAGTELGKSTWVAEVEVPSEVQQDQMVTDRRDLDLPVTQIRLLQDPDEGDPMGKAVMARIAGANEAAATVAASLITQIDKILHPARFVTATSPLSDDDIEESRGAGRLAVITTKDDMPQYEQSPELPANTLDVVEWDYGQMDSAIGLNKPAQGSDDSNEVSGVARRIAVDQSLVSVSRMQHGVNVAWERYWRIKLQLAMKYFGQPQMIRYVGVDGASKQEWFTGNNFAQVTGVTVRPGTGTLMPPAEKVNYVSQLQSIGYIDADEAIDVARPAFASQLGVPDSPHVQRIERQVSSWLEGPPEGWEEQAQAYQLQVVQHAQMAQMAFDAGQMVPPEPEAPWSPFESVPVDFEPAVAMIRKRRLGHVMAGVAYAAQPQAWRAILDQAFEQMKMVAAPQPMPGQMPPEQGQQPTQQTQPTVAVA